MNFKQPEILYLLFLLLIPIIIHLVRWKKYKTTYFTNVAFLQELEIKSRKSRKIKELLVLLLRLLTFAFLIWAFAQPYKTSLASQKNIQKSHNIIFLDNSLSLSRLEGKIDLWQNIIQQIQQLPEKQNYTIVTNDQIYKQIQGKHLADILYQIEFSNKSTRHNKILKQLKLWLPDPTHTRQNIIYASDLQNVFDEKINDSLFNKNIQYYFLTTNNRQISNISIDSLWIHRKTPDNYHLKLQLSANQNGLQTTVYLQQNNEIMWQSNVKFKDSLKKIFDINLPTKNINGKIIINDKGFQFDNKLYFTLSQPERIKVLVIGKKLPEYIRKIYTKDEFELSFELPKRLNYNQLQKYDLIILSEFDNSFNLSSSLFYRYISQYGNILLIPAAHQEKSLEQLLQSWHINTRISLDTTRVWLNRINYEHPLFDGVFLKKVSNFAYPFVKNHYQLSRPGTDLYRLSDQSVFAGVYQRKGKIYFINSSLSIDNNNFTEAASLIVPLFYQIARNSNKKQKLYYINGQKNTFDVLAKIPKDGVVKLISNKEEFIPRQINKTEKISIETQNLPQKAGIYNIMYNDKNLGQVAFNYNRQENKLYFLKLPDLPNIRIINDLESFKQSEMTFYQEKKLWKIFITLTLLFLLLEMLVIKFWK